jgi:hypothetical protein
MIKTCLDKNRNLKQVQKFGVLIPEEAIPEGIEFESFADVYDRCFRIMAGLPIK